MRGKLLVSVIGVSVLPSVCWAAERHVPGAYPTIQAAINASAPGDHVVLASGIYNQAVDLLGKRVTLRSTNPDNEDVVAATILDGSGLPKSIVTCSQGETEETVIRGLTMRGGITGTNESGVTRGGAIYCRLSGPQIVQCVFENNRAGLGGAVGTYYGWPRFEACTFRSNTATAGGDWGGGAIGSRGGEIVVEQCVFESNSTTGAAVGGAISAVSGSVEAVNSLFWRNTGYWAGAISNKHAELTAVNCTLVENSAGSYAGGVLSLYSDAVTTFRNCVVWQNTFPSGADFIDASGAASEISFCNISTPWSGLGQNNISAEPLFISQGTGDLRLTESSPCIDLGDEAAVAGIPQDLAGAARVTSVTVDIGAYEVQDPAVVTGACCMPDGHCTAMTLAECHALAGTYGGDDVTCATQECQVPCAADVNQDGIVDFGDVLAMLMSWGTCGGCSEDLSGDGWVDFDDLVSVLVGFGPCGQ